MMLVPIVVTMTVAFAAFAVYIDRVEADNRLADIDDELLRAERSFALQLQPGEALDPPDGNEGEDDDDLAGGGATDGVEPPIQLLVAEDGQILANFGADSTLPTVVLAELASRRGLSTVESSRHRVLVTPRSDGTTQITALDLEQFDAAAADFRRTLLAGGLVISILATAVVWLLTSRLIRPVTRMAATANRIADGALDTEIAHRGGSREISDLGSDLERMMTQLRTVIAEREQAAAEATQARDDMRRFLADVSHELRTPLTALKGYSDLYAGSMLEEPEALDRAMGRIGDESQRLSMLVTDMLALAREAPTTERAEHFDASDTVRSVVDDLRAAHPSIPISLEMNPNTEHMVFGHADGLHQAILNVGSNACQHTEPHAGVQFEVTTTPTSAVINVIDHGPGIDPTEIDKIFLPFYRHQTSRGRDGRGGAGLGLAITNQIIERLNGTVSVAATPGGGATFTLTVPLAPRSSTTRSEAGTKAG